MKEPLLNIIAYYEQFLVLPQCFQKSSSVEESGNVYMWEMDNRGRHLTSKVMMCMSPKKTTNFQTHHIF